MKTIATISRFALGLLGVAVLSLVNPYSVSAQNTNGNISTNRNANFNKNSNLGSNANANSNSSTGVTKTPPCPSADAAPAKVTDVYKEIIPGPVPATGNPSPAPAATPEYASQVRDVELGDVIVVEGENFKTLFDQAACEKKNIVLYLDDRPLKNVTAFPPTDPIKSTLRFTLKRTEDSRDVWTYVLGKPSWGPRTTKVSVGIIDKFAVESERDVNFKVIPHDWFIFWLIILILLLLSFLILGIKSNLLRDTVASLGGGGRRPYSLARTQIAWWFFLVLASYLLIGMVTGDFSTTITGTVLGLLGISAGTAVGSAIVDSSKSTPEADATQAASAQDIKTRLTALDNDIAQAKTSLAANKDDTAAAQLLAARQKEKEEKLSQLKKLNNQSENFLLDILSDINGVSFHRFQIAAWTLVLGIIFIVQVYKFLAMPDFNGSLLALLGISAGTYISLKIPQA